jgi:hypothetical protein
MSFCPKPRYFERDCPVCTRSASNFCRNPLIFLAYAMWVKWWYHANFSLSEFICSAFQFQGHLAQKIIKCMKNNRWSQKWLKIYDVALNGAFWTHKKSGVKISSKNVILCNRWVFVRNPDTSKEIVHFVHEVHPVFALTLSTF